jgi:hypothetical protein
MWNYKGEIINSIEDLGDETPFGFIYIVTHIPSGRKYLGKKQLFNYNKVKLGKKELALLPKSQGRPTKFKQVIKESNWKEYYGSHEEILNLIKEKKYDDFYREIIKVVYNKKTLTYYETKFQFIYEVLEKPDEWINNNILGTFFSSDFIK